jgi:dynein heavy chain
LEQWKKEYDLFGQVIKIPLFKKYTMWKSYYLWRKNVRSKRMRFSQNVLSSNLFILSDSLRAALLQIRDICAEISKLSLYSIDEGAEFSMDQFLRIQAAHKESVQEKIEGYISSLREVVLQGCETSLQASGFSDNDYITDGDEALDHAITLQTLETYTAKTLGTGTIFF